MLEEYYRVVCKVIEVLVKYKLFLCFKKCEFDKQWIKYSGFVILGNQVVIDFIKIAEVWYWPTLKNCRVTSFLRLY